MLRVVNFSIISLNMEELVLIYHVFFQFFLSALLVVITSSNISIDFYI